MSYLVDCSPAVDQELSAILNELWKLDVNRVKPGKDYTINLQVGVWFETSTNNNKCTIKCKCWHLNWKVHM